MAGYFITGTGTDIGKTWLTAALLRHWRAAGVPVRAVKPVMSGVDAGDLTASDAGQLLLAMGQAVTAQAVADISPWRFAAPLSPDQAAAKEGRSVSFDELVAWNRRLASADFQGVCLTEGVGGVCVPLDAHHTVLDWMAALAQPAVLVAGTYLGSLSHTLTALLALRSRGIDIAAIVINETPGSTVSLADTLSSLLCHVGDVPLIGISRAESEVGIRALSALIFPPKNILHG